MIPTKFILFTFATIFLTRSINANYQNQDYVESVVNHSSVFMGYLVDVNQDALAGVKNDIKVYLNYDSEAESLSDALFEFYSANLEELDSNNNLNEEEIIKAMEGEVMAVLESNKSNLLELKTEGLFQKVQDIYMRYLLSFMNYFLKSNVSNFKMPVNIFVQIQQYMNDFIINDAEFVKSLTKDESHPTKQHNIRMKAYSEFGNGVAKEESMKIMQFMHDQEVLRTHYAKLRKENALNYSNQVKGLFYSMTRGINFEIENYSKTRLRMSEIAFAYYRCIQELDNEDLKLNIINELRSENNYAKEFETEENPITLIFSYSIAAILRVAHVVNPKDSQSQLAILFPRITTNAETMGPFFKNMYDEYSGEIWANWNEEENDDIKTINSIMMVEIFNHVNEVDIQFSENDVDYFVEHSGDLLMAPLDVLELANVFEVFFEQLCPLNDNVEFYYYLYTTLLEFRYKNLSNWNETWSVTLDKYLDLKYDNETDKKYLSYYPTMKILNVFRMLYSNEDLEGVTMHELSDDVVETLVANENTHCTPMNQRIIRMVQKNGFESVKSVEEAFHSLGGIYLDFTVLKTIFKIQISAQSSTQKNERTYQSPPTYEFSAKVYSGIYKNIKSQIGQQDVDLVKEVENNQPLRNNRKGNSSSVESRGPTNSSSDEEPENQVLDTGKNSKTNSDEEPEIQVLDAEKNSKTKSEEPETQVLNVEKNNKSKSLTWEEPVDQKASDKINADHLLGKIEGNLKFLTDNFNKDNLKNNVKNDVLFKTSEQSDEMSEETDPKKFNNKRKNSKTLSDQEVENSSQEDENNLNKENLNNQSFENQPVDISESDDGEDVLDNKINTVDRPENLVEVVSGGDLTRQELDILKNPNVMQQLKDLENGERKIVYENADGSLTEIIYVQVVPYKSPCYDEIDN